MSAPSQNPPQKGDPNPANHANLAPFAAMADLEAGLDFIRQSPIDHGRLELIVRRPRESAREVVEEARLDLLEGLVGDNWKARGSKNTPDKSAHLDMQLTVMNARVIALLAREKTRWPLAGDQLFVDLDLSTLNTPPGTRWAIGSAVIETTAMPHSGCSKFQARFGPHALKFVNSPLGRELCLRGINAKVVQAGVIRVGDVLKRL